MSASPARPLPPAASPASVARLLSTIEGDREDTERVRNACRRLNKASEALIAALPERTRDRLACVAHRIARYT